MVHKDIFSHADLRALHVICSQQGIRSDERVFVQIVSLESVRIAYESYVLLRQLVDLGCVNPQLNFLSVVGCLSLELHKVEHDLLPPLQDQEAKLEDKVEHDQLPPLQDQEAELEGRVVQALLSLKNSANAILRLVESFQKFEGLKGVISSRAEGVGAVLGDAADLVLRGTLDIVWLKKRRVPSLVELISTLMATPVSFPH